MIILYTMTQRQGQLEKSENQKFHKSKKAVAGKRMKRVVGCRGWWDAESGEMQNEDTEGGRRRYTKDK